MEQSAFFLDVKLSPGRLEKKSGFLFLSFFFLQQNKLGDWIGSHVVHKGDVDTLILQVNLQKTYLENCLLKPTPLPPG